MILHCLEAVLSSPGKYLLLVSWEILRTFKSNVEKTRVFLRRSPQSVVGGRRRSRSSVSLWALTIELKPQMKTVSKFWNGATKIMLTQINKASLHWGILQFLRLGQEQLKCSSMCQWLPMAPSYPKPHQTTPSYGNHRNYGETYAMIQP